MRITIDDAYLWQVENYGLGFLNQFYAAGLVTGQFYEMLIFK